MNANPSNKTRSTQPEIQLCAPGSLYGKIVRYRSDKQRICWCKSSLTGWKPRAPCFFSRTAGPRQVMFAKRASEKRRLGCGGKSCRNGFLAEISSGDRPVLSVFHEIRCHQTNIGTFIRKDSDHAAMRHRERTRGLPKPAQSEHLK